MEGYAACAGTGMGNVGGKRLGFDWGNGKGEEKGMWMSGVGCRCGGVGDLGVILALRIGV